MRLAVAVAMMMFSTAALAQPAMTQPVAAPAAASGPHGEELSPDVALAWSLGGTLASYGMVGAGVAGRSQATAIMGTAGMFGVLLAPSFGHWYAGKYLTRGTGLRALGLVTALVGALVDNGDCGLFYTGHDPDQPADCGEDFRTVKGTAIILSGVALFVGGTVDDIVTAPRRARRHNEHLQQLSVAPVFRSDGAAFVLSGRY